MADTPAQVKLTAEQYRFGSKYHSPAKGGRAAGAAPPSSPLRQNSRIFPPPPREIWIEKRQRILVFRRKIL